MYLITICFVCACILPLSLPLDYSEDRVVVLLNSDLADTLGNLLQRVTSKKLHPEEARGVQVSSEIFQDTNLVNSLLQLPGLFANHVHSYSKNSHIH